MMRRRERAFSLLEIMMAMAVLAIAILGTIAAIASDGGVRSVTKETEIANRAIMRWVQHLRSRGVAGAAAEHRPLPGNPNAANPGLPGDPLGFLVGLPTGGAGASLRTVVLCEADAQARFPMTPAQDWDLDGDGVMNEPEGTSDRAAYSILTPVEITVRWTPESGGPEMRVTTYSMIYPTPVNK